LLILAALFLLILPLLPGLRRRTRRGDSG